ncbi:hypothetical protein AV530_006366 [Patagioenas fasciata monilis]|uniref:Uncharacterized protein n=1 Tax=Patagioenas fasciata monilis TaxID=372326 RepID=A0A1V4KGG5_PATFA|nr:hypothetical protein AV530_006366 [Patagioenas fasciata monilis]
MGQPPFSQETCDPAASYLPLILDNQVKIVKIFTSGPRQQKDLPLSPVRFHLLIKKKIVSWRRRAVLHAVQRAADKLMLLWSCTQKLTKTSTEKKCLPVKVQKAANYYHLLSGTEFSGEARKQTPV